MSEDFFVDQYMMQKNTEHLLHKSVHKKESKSYQTNVFYLVHRWIQIRVKAK